MNSVRPVIVSRASTPPAVGPAMAAFMVFKVFMGLALACGTAHESQAAESDSGSGLLGDTKAEDPALEWAKMAAGTLPERPPGAVMATAIPRTSLPSTERTFILPRTSLGPVQEWMGMSKLAIPLLVADLVGDHTVRAARAMTVQAANAGR